MSNIHGFNEDEENKPKTEPFPSWPQNNVFQGKGRTLSGKVIEPEPTMVDLGSNDEPVQQNYPTQPYQGPNFNLSQSIDTFWSPNMENVQPQWYHLIFMTCFPCFLGPLCSTTRKKDYFRLFTSFIFWISIVEIIYFIVTLIVGGFAPVSVNTMIGPPTQTLINCGAKWVPLMKYNFQYWRFITPTFMHAGIIHLFFNLLVQLSLGLAYEKTWGLDKGKYGQLIGTGKIIVVYLISGFSCILLSCVIFPKTVSVGASGAILGLIGAKIAHIICTWAKTPVQIKIVQSISVGFIVFFTFMFGFSGNVDWAGHLGGLFGGLVIGFPLFASEIERKWLYLVTLIVPFIVLGLYILTCVLIFAFAL